MFRQDVQIIEDVMLNVQIIKDVMLNAQIKNDVYAKCTYYKGCLC